RTSNPWGLDIRPWAQLCRTAALGRRSLTHSKPTSVGFECRRYMTLYRDAWDRHFRFNSKRDISFDTSNVEALSMLEIFIPTYPPDLKQIQLLLRSVDTSRESGAVASLNIAAIAPAASFVPVQEVGTHKFGSRTRYLQPRDLGFGEPNGSREQGWSLQQA